MDSIVITPKDEAEYSFIVKLLDKLKVKITPLRDDDCDQTLSDVDAGHVYAQHSTPAKGLKYPWCPTKEELEAEIDQALADFEAGDYYTQAEMKERIRSWFRK